MKVPRAAYEEAQALTAHAARYGWSSLGIDREDAPTLAAILEEALHLLAKRAKQGSKR
jgi:hypothetical protein